MSLESESVDAQGWRPCSDRARERGDPLVATGSRGMRWFLIEVATGWGRNALLDPPFDLAIGRGLVTRYERAGFRLLAIRRTGRRSPQRGGSWAMVDSRPGQESIRWGRYDDAKELLDVPTDGTAGEASDRMLFAVCTHGRHDQCCALRGRRVVGQLAAAFPEETWECSHLGGDRFAGTMVILPHGLYYGYADDSDVSAIGAAALDGRVVERFYRGRSALSHPVQAAQHYARQELGGDRIADWEPLAEEETDAGWTVRLHSDDGDVEVRIAEGTSEPLLSTCDATRYARVRQYRLESIGAAAPTAVEDDEGIA